MRFGILFGLLSVCGFAAAAANPSTGTTKWSFRAGAAPRVSVQTISGNIIAVAGEADAVGVEATVRGSDAAEYAKWVIEVKQDGDNVRARACCGPCEGHGGNCRGHVDFAVRVPAAAQLALSDVSGDITVSGVRGRQQINTVSGDVAWNGLCAKDCRIDATTVSGDVRLGLAPQSSFALEYGSVSGSYKDGFATTILEQAGRPGSRVRAQYGKAEGAIACTTVSGDLALERK